MKRSSESGYAKRKNANEQEERIKNYQNRKHFSIKLLPTQLPHPPVLRDEYPPSLKKKKSGLFTQKGDTEGDGTFSDTSVNVSEQLSENATRSGPALWPSTNKNWFEKCRLVLM
jgi:hypothetical protein